MRSSIRSPITSSLCGLVSTDTMVSTFQNLSGLFCSVIMRVIITQILLPCEGALNKLKLQHQEDPNSTVLASNKPALLRSLFTVGALCRHFDFDQEEFKGSNKVRSSVTRHDFWIIKVLNPRKLFYALMKVVNHL